MRIQVYTFRTALTEFRGAIGAWIKNVAAEDGERPQSDEEAIELDEDDVGKLKLDDDPTP